MNIKIISLICTALLLSACTNGPAPFGSIPTEAQVEWQKKEYNMFIHFGPNTFTNGKEKLTISKNRRGRIFINGVQQKQYRITHQDLVN